MSKTSKSSLEDRLMEAIKAGMAKKAQEQAVESVTKVEAVLDVLALLTQHVSCQMEVSGRVIGAISNGIAYTSGEVALVREDYIAANNLDDAPDLGDIKGKDKNEKTADFPKKPSMENKIGK